VVGGRSSKVNCAIAIHPSLSESRIDDS
jgi:hypothetical protein